MNLSAKMKRIVFLSAIPILLLLIADCSYALKMNVDPPRVEISLNSGGEQGGHISVVNYDEENPIHVKAYLNDLVYLPDGSNDFLAAGTTPWSIFDWLKISPTEFDVSAGEERKVRYIVEIPEGVEGGRYGVVFFEVSPPLEQIKDKTGAAINIRIGSIFLLTVRGTEKYNAELEDLIVDSPDENGAFLIHCVVKNAGNVLIRPSGSVKIIDTAQTVLTELKLNENKSGILPGTSRQFSVKCDQDKISSGEYFAQVILDYGGDVLLGGQTSFNLELPN